MSASDNDKSSGTPLPQVPRWLRKGYAPPIPTYQRLYRGAIDGVYPAEQDGSRWTVNDADLPQVARAFGLKPLKS